MCFYPTTTIIFSGGSVMPGSNYVWYKNSLVNQSNIAKSFNTHGCKIQNFKVGSAPVLLNQEKHLAKFAIMQYNHSETL